MSDRMFIPISASVVRKLEHVAEGDQTVMDELVEHALDGDPASWPKTAELAAPKTTSRQLSDFVRCSCCVPVCQKQFQWRGTVRCDCPTNIASSPDAGRVRVVQPDLDRE